MSDWRAISNRGERVSHLYRNDLYYAHLALYRFALPHARGGHVLDAGCGSGYGAAYLARNGASLVDAVDIDPEAIAFCDQHFAASKIRFRQMDVRHLTGFGEATLDLVLSSNTLEHVPDVPGFLRSVHGLLKPAGTLVIAVPPVTTEHQMLLEMSNPYHLNIWTPRQWLHVVAEYFGSATAFGHRVARVGVSPDFDNRPEDTVLTEADFEFPELKRDAQEPNTLSVVIVARDPLPVRELPTVGAPVRFVDQSFTRSAPRVPPLRPDAFDAPTSSIATLPLRAWQLLVRGGVSALADEARRYAWWRLQRLQARRARGKWRPPGS